MSIIYLLESSNEDRTVYKIGYTKKSVQKRINSCQTGNAYKIREVCRFYTKYNRKIETALHNFYGHNKKEGEWFYLDIKDVANFIRTCERIEKNFDTLKENSFFNINI